jgi:hypothetical protein
MLTNRRYERLNPILGTTAIEASVALALFDTSPPVRVWQCWKNTFNYLHIMKESRTAGPCSKFVCLVFKRNPQTKLYSHSKKKESICNCFFQPTPNERTLPPPHRPTTPPPSHGPKPWTLISTPLPIPSRPQCSSPPPPPFPSHAEDPESRAAMLCSSFWRSPSVPPHLLSVATLPCSLPPAGRSCGI